MRNALVGWIFAVPVSALIGCGVGDSSLVPPSADGPFEPFEGPVPRAVCGPGSNPEPESTMQGQGPARPTDAPYTCNVELVGQQGTEASWQMARFDVCAYYDTYGEGTIVVDTSDSANPVMTTALKTTPAMLYPHESLAVNETRGLLGGVQGYPPIGGGTVRIITGLPVQGETPYFDVYDVAEDCRQPQLKASVAMGNTNGHEGDWAPDGLTYYGSDYGAITYYPIDVSDATDPKLLLIWPSITGTHGLSIGDDGSRAYFAGAKQGYSTPFPPPRPDGGYREDLPNGLVIADTSDIHFRRPNPDIRVIGEVYWEDGDGAQHTIPVTIDGKPYVIFVDDSGHGAVRIIDISDEKNPFVVSKLKLEINMFDIGNSHYCGVPQREEPGIVGCGYWYSGVRFFDIRDPYRPKEIAYYEPYIPLFGMTARVHFDPVKGEAWTTNQSAGFFIVRFTNGVWPFKD